MLVARGAQRFHSYRQRELLAEETAHESSAANLSSIFETAKGQQNFAPARKDGFAREHFAEHHAIAVEQHLAGGFERGGAVVGFDWIEKRPTAGTVTRARGAPVALAAAAFGVDQGAKIVEAVSGDDSGGNEFP